MNLIVVVNSLIVVHYKLALAGVDLILNIAGSWSLFFILLSQLEALCTYELPCAPCARKAGSWSGIGWSLFLILF